MEYIKLEDVLDILLGKKSSNPNVLKILNEELSIRKGKFGAYLFYKKKTWNKPKFYSMQQLFKVKKTEKIIDVTKFSSCCSCHEFPIENFVTREKFPDVTKFPS